MNNQWIQRVIEYFKEDKDGIASCRIKVCVDGSVYVDGNDIECVFEESPDAFEEAVKYVESKGYTRKD